MALPIEQAAAILLITITYLSSGSLAQTYGDGPYNYAAPEAEPEVQTYVNGEPGTGGAYTYPEPETGVYGNVGANNVQANAQPELSQGSVELNCLYANGISSGCNGAGSVSNYACGGDQYCYCYAVVGSGSLGTVYYGGCDDGNTNCVGGTFSSANNYVGMCCSTTDCNTSGVSAVAYSRVVVQFWLCVSIFLTCFLF